MTIQLFPLETSKIRRNLQPAELVEIALRRGEGQLASTGSFVVETGQHTGRSAEDKYVVRDAETEKAIEHGQGKLDRKGCDMIVANDVSVDKMGGAVNRVHIITRNGVDSWDRMGKDAVAARLAERIADALA